jgi:hypothetical protein
MAVRSQRWMRWSYVVACVLCVAAVSGCTATAVGHGERSVSGFPSSTEPSSPAVQTAGSDTSTAVSSPSTALAPPSLAQVTDLLDTLVPGDQTDVVPVPRGSEAIAYDQSGQVTFWTFTTAWTPTGASSYPFNAALVGPADATATGTLLPGMADATFIVDGAFSGDGSANAVAFTTGPHGWGVIKAEANGNLISSGQGVSFSEIGLEEGDYFVNGQLETADCSATLSIASCGGVDRVLKFWSWNGQEFVLTATAGLPS